MRKRFLLYPLLLFALTLFASAASVETSNWDYSDTNHAFSCDLNLSGADMDGQIFAALFAESGRMKNVTACPAAETVHLVVPGTDTTDYIRVLWTNSRYAPLAEPAVLRMPDNGKKAYENFEDSLRKSQRNDWAQSGDPTRLLVSSSEALPWAEYGVEKVIPGGNNFYVLEFLNYTDTKACKEALEKLPCVRYAVYDAVIKVDVDDPGAALFAGETQAPLSWGVAETGIGEYAADLKGQGLDKQEIVVAVVDTGVDSGHEFLKGRVLAGYDFVEEDETPQDEQGHGTHVAGIVTDCTPGMNVKILPVRVLNKWGNSTPLIVRRGIEYAVAHGANVINLSLGLPGKNPVIEDAVQDAISRKITVVVAASNKNTDAAEYCPANIEKCITVAAMEKDADKLNRWELSNYGKAVDIAAPGGKIYSCIPKNRYDEYSGTSMAAPYVTAAVALLMCEHGTGQTPYQIENTLKIAAYALPENDTDIQWKLYKRDNPGVLWTDFLGAGFLNARPFISFYALLYSDGEFVFQKGNTPNPDKTLLATYPVAVTDGGAQYAPWYENRSAIRTVTFADTLQPRSTATWFYNCGNLTEIRGLERLDTSKVKDMSQMFARCTALTKLDLTALDTSGVTNTRQMFQNCTALTELDLTGWNTANVTDMADMFNGCTALKTVFVSDSLKTDKVSNSTGMFGDCTALVGGNGTKYDSGHTDKAYARIDGGTSRPGYFTDKNGVYAILYGNGELVFQNGDTPESGRTVTKTYAVDLNAVYQWDFDKKITTTPWYNERESVKVVNFADKISPSATTCWFYSCKNMERVNNIQNLDIKNVTNMFCMFYNCMKLTALDVSHFDTANVTNMYAMFDGCSGLTALDVSHFDTANVTSMGSMFANCSGLTALNLSTLDTANVTSMNSMFANCSGLTTLDLSHFDTANVTDMSSMFYGCSNLTALDLSHFNTANVTAMSFMFVGCSGLTELDLSHFDTAKVYMMRGMFGYCGGLTALDLSHFNTANVTAMSEMFAYCSGLTALDLSHFNTANVTDMKGMFYDCSGLTVLDVSHFDTANVTNMTYMFYGCFNLKTIYTSDKFTTASVPEKYQYSSSGMFNNCTSLVGGAGTKFDSGHTDKEYARIDGGTSAPGYFTRK